MPPHLITVKPKIMKQKFLLVLWVAFLSIQIISAQTSRNCSTMENLGRLIQNDPHLLDRMNNIEQFTEHWINRISQSRAVPTIITIPVVVHVVHNNASENISDAQIQSQIDVLNEDLRKLNADVVNVPAEFSSLAADIQIEFCLASIDPSGAATSGITRTFTNNFSFSTNDVVKFNSFGGKDAWPSNKYFNIWSCDLGSTLGYAQFPGGSASTDGIVVNYRYFGRGGTAQVPFDKGRTATHEVGHWLNLRHIWGDAFCGNDFIGDTPTQSGPSFGCPGYPQFSCSSSDMFMNYMDYTDDA